MERNGQSISIAAHVTGIRYGSLHVKQCPTAPADVKAKIIQEEEAKKKETAKRKAESVQGILDSSARAAAAAATPEPGRLFSPTKQQSDGGTRLKQLRIEPAQVIVEIFTNIWFQ